MRFVIAGLGSIGRRHLKNLISLGHIDIVLLRSRANYPKDDELKEFPAVTNVREALKRKPDAFIVSNPTSLHLTVAIPVADQGCHILLEKPISHNMDHVNEFGSLVDEKKSKVLVGFQFRFHPGLLKIKELISNRKIGRVLYFHCCWGEFLPGWHPLEDYRQGYSARRDLGGGVVLSLCHPLDYLHWLFGDVDELIAIAKKTSDLEIEVEDDAEMIMNFKSGIIGYLHLDYIQQPPRHSLDIVGTAGSIRWDYMDGMVHHYRNDVAKWESYPIKKEFTRNDLFLAEMRNFLAYMNGTQEPACSLNEGIYVQKLIEAIYLSSSSHTFIKIQQ